MGGVELSGIIIVTLSSVLMAISFNRKFEAIRKLETEKMGAWPLSPYRPGDHMRDLFAGHLGPKAPLLENGFYLISRDPSLTMSAYISLKHLCRPSGLPCRVLGRHLAHGSPPELIDALEEDTIYTDDELHDALGIKDLVVIYVDNGVLVDCASGSYFPAALQSRFRYILEPI
jgi:hypothetical protein